MSAPIVTTRALTRRYGTAMAIDHVDLDIRAGSIVGLIGPNGSGKTTLLKALLGLGDCEGGLEVLGLDPRTQRDALMQEVCFMADVAVLPRWISVAQAVEFVAGVHPRFDRAKCESFLAQTRLEPKMKVRQMSKGMIVQLHLALVMSIDARLLVLDEPTLGLDILYRKQFYRNLVERYFDETRTIIVATHQVEEVEHLVTHLVFMRDGKTVLLATMDELADRYVEVAVPGDRLEAARALAPLDERTLFGKTVFMFDSPTRERLSDLGELRTPSLADLFIATMKGTRP